MSISLVLPEPLAEDLAEKARLSDETGGVLLARYHQADNGDIRLLGRSTHWVPLSAYLHRSSRAMSIASEGYVEALGFAERDGAVPLWLHTHPGGCPLPSERDRQVDAAIADVFRLPERVAFLRDRDRLPGRCEGRSCRSVAVHRNLGERRCKCRIH